MLAGLAAAAFALGGCSGNKVLTCDDPGEYASSASIGPLRVPDDLGVPEQAQALVIPGVTAAAEDNAATATGCIAAPPPFSDGGSG